MILCPCSCLLFSRPLVVSIVVLVQLFPFVLVLLSFRHPPRPRQLRVHSPPPQPGIYHLLLVRGRERLRLLQAWDLDPARTVGYCGAGCCNGGCVWETQ